MNGFSHTDKEGNRFFRRIEAVRVAFEPTVCLAANFFMGLINFFEPPERKTTN
jgi:hypothetical protein|nr:MAG TPA: hypothetical protein [Caudoviricetes sp.]